MQVLWGGSSTATLCGLAAARYRLLKNMNWDILDMGLADAPKLDIVLSNQAHSTVFKALSLLGFGKKQLKVIPSDNEGRLTYDSLPELSSNTLLILQAGNVNTGSFDEFDTICREANDKGAWVHIDGAFGLWAECSASKKTSDQRHPHG